MPHAFFNRDGFTLIELSVVLVIIGLLAGGVLVGRDLVESSRVRAQATQVEKYSSAVNTFKGKFGALPGDIKNEDSRRFGLLTSTWDGSSVPSGTWGYPNINGIYDSTHRPIQFNWISSSEQALFWPQLRRAGLIDFRAIASGYIYQNGANQYSGTTLLYPDTVDAYFPAMALNNAYGIIPVTLPAIDGNNWWAFGIRNYDWSIDSSNALRPSLIPAQAMKLDQKIDDGVPNSGSARILKFPNAVEPSSGLYYTGFDNENDDNIAQGSYTPANCVSNAGATYNVSNTAVACKMFVKIQ